MPRIAAASRSYLAVADAAGVMRDLSLWLESVSPLGKVVGWLDATGLNDVVGRTMSATETAQEFEVSGRWDDAPESSPDAVLSSIVGRPVAVQYGPAGNAPGQRRVAGRFVCLSYQISSRSGHPVRFEARFRQDGPVALEVW